MQFIYLPDIQPRITLSGETHKYLFKIRRTKKDDPVFARNLKDDYLYIYETSEINKKEAVLSLREKKFLPKKPKKFFHLAWCVIEPKNIEKTLPFLNETGVGKISFVYCDRSQKNFKLNMQRLEKILINSCQQCGRSDLMQIETLNSSKEFFEKYENFYALDFDGDTLSDYNNCGYPFLIGPEGGFSDTEKKCFTNKIRLEGFILRSETAAAGISSKFLL
jgi:16S rRNA (uracil1498-N3)-methyltransferase